MRSKKYQALFFSLIVFGWLFLPYLFLTAESVTLTDPLNLGEGKKYDSIVDEEKVTLTDPLNLGEGGLVELYTRVIKAILGMVGILALIMFIIGGITWMTSAGSPEKVKKGKDTIVWAVLGLAFIFFSYAILDFILRVLMNRPR